MDQAGPLLVILRRQMLVTSPEGEACLGESDVIHDIFTSSPSTVALVRAVDSQGFNAKLELKVPSCSAPNLTTASQVQGQDQAQKDLAAVDMLILDDPSTPLVADLWLETSAVINKKTEENI